MYLYLSTQKSIKTTSTNFSGKAANYRTSTTALLIKVCLFTVCLLSLIIDLAQAQAAPVKEWDKRFGGSNEDRAKKIIPTADGGYLLGGHSYSGISGDKTAANKGAIDYWVVKISSDGTKQWDKSFGGDGFDDLTSLLQTSDGGYLLGGHSYSSISGDKTAANKGADDYWIVKITSNGTKQWDKSFGGDYNEYLTSLTQTSDGGYLLGGTSESGISGDKTTLSTSYSTSYSSHWIVKITSTGIKQWDLSAGYAVIYNEGVNVIKDNDGGYLLLSEATDDNYNHYSQLFKITGSGQIQWSRTFKANPVSGNGLFHYSVLRSGFQTSDGGFILAGVTDAEAGKDVSQPSKGKHDFWVVKTTRQIQPGEIVMSNGSTGVGPGNTYYDPGFVANYQDNLDVTHTLVARAGYKVRLTFTSFQLEGIHDKLYIYNGSSTSAPLIGVYTGYNNPGTITSSTGSLTLRFVSDGSINYPGWVANISYVSAGALRTAAEETAAEETQETLLKLEAFPNPFTEKITFNFTNQQTGPVSLRIYDSKGVEAADVFAAEVQAGETQSVEWQPRGHQPGVYIVRLATPGKVVTNKVVLVR